MTTPPPAAHPPNSQKPSRSIPGRAQSLQSLLLIIVSGLLFLSITLSGVWLARSRTQEISSELRSRGGVLAQILASQAELGVLVGNRETLQQLISGLSRDPDVVWAAVLDQDGSILAEGPRPRPPGLMATMQAAIPPDSPASEVADGEPQTWKTWRIQATEGRYRVVEAPVSTTKAHPSAEELALGVQPSVQEGASTTPIGRVQLLFSLSRADEAIRRLWEQIGIVTLLVWIVGMLLTLPLTRLLVRPLEHLSASSLQIATGQRDVQLPASPFRELAELSGAFEQMIQGLTQRDAALAANAEELTRQAEALKQGQQELMTANQSLLQLNQTLRFNQDQLHATNLELLKASDLKSAFLASMSHELRTPLNSIIGYSECLIDELDGPINTEQRDSLERVLRNGRHLLELINQVLDLSRIEAGRLELQFSHLDVIDFGEECLGLVRPLVRGKPILLRQEVHAGPNSASTPEGSDTSIRLHADASRLRQVLLNLLSNAVHYTDSGEVVLILEAQGDGVGLTVQDTGRGIPPERQEEVFAPFRRLENSPGNGAGLGLAITRRLVDAMGGTLSLESQVGKGSRFTVWLPYSPLAKELDETSSHPVTKLGATERIS